MSIDPSLIVHSSSILCFLLVSDRDECQDFPLEPVIIVTVESILSPTSINIIVTQALKEKDFYLDRITSVSI
jgi:hypothetical protein